MKKYVWLLVVALLVILPLITSCGGKPTPAPTTPAPTTPAPTTPTPTATSTGGITAIPHTLEGRADCLLCHKTGVGGATAVPADHAGRTNDLCAACHKPASK